MTKSAILWVVAALQAVFLAWTLLFLVLTRARRWSERKEDERAYALLAGPTHRLVLGEATADDLAAALRQLPPLAAARHLVGLAGGQLAQRAQEDLVAIVRRDAWVARALEGVNSRWWWRRMDAARLVAVVADEEDAPMIASLLLDRHAAVVSAAAPALGRIIDQRLVVAVLDTMHTRPATLRLQLGLALRRHWQVASPLLADRLRAGADAARLRVWITLAETLDSPLCLGQILQFPSHPSVEVRIAAARALGKCFRPDTVPVLRSMLRDDDWRIRGQAARSLGLLNATEAVEELAMSLTDPSWWVRFRAALALAGLGDAGRSALLRAGHSADPYARDMAEFVGGLPEGSRIELSAR